MGENDSPFHFMRLFLRHFEKLQYVKLLPIFIKWHFLILKKLTHTITRKKAKTMTVSSFVRKNSDSDHSSENQEETIDKLFDKFQKAWNNVCANWQKLTGEESNFEIMSLNTPVSEFIMDTGPEQEPNERKQMSPLHMTIKVLQKYSKRFSAKSTFSSMHRTLNQP